MFFHDCRANQNNLSIKNLTNNNLHRYFLIRQTRKEHGWQNTSETIHC
jgi:hypothetical protein